MFSEGETEVSETSAPLVSCLKASDFSQHIGDQHEDDILCVAPGEGGKIQSVQNKEAEAFPTLFPCGKQTLDDDRPVKLTLSQ